MNSVAVIINKIDPPGIFLVFDENLEEDMRYALVEI